MTKARPRFVIGITGGTGSGKTTLAAGLLRKYAQEGACLLDQDSYYRDRSHLSISERKLINYDAPEAFEHDLLLLHLQRLVSGEPVKKPVYCFATHTRSREAELVHPASVILLEGLFMLWDLRLRSLMNLRIYVALAEMCSSGGGTLNQLSTNIWARFVPCTCSTSSQQETTRTLSFKITELWKSFSQPRKK